VPRRGAAGSAWHHWRASDGAHGERYPHIRSAASTQRVALARHPAAPPDLMDELRRPRLQLSREDAGGTLACRHRAPPPDCYHAPAEAIASATASPSCGGQAGAGRQGRRSFTATRPPFRGACFSDTRDTGRARAARAHAIGFSWCRASEGRCRHAVLNRLGRFAYCLQGRGLRARPVMQFPGRSRLFEIAAEASSGPLVTLEGRGRPSEGRRLQLRSIRHVLVSPPSSAELYSELIGDRPEMTLIRALNRISSGGGNWPLGYLSAMCRHTGIDAAGRRKGVRKNGCLSGWHG